MKPLYHVSDAGLELIMSFEGYRASAAQLPDGRWTIGYGHTKTARAGAHVTEADAKILLLYDLIEISVALREWIFTPLNQNQFDALACFTFNVGLKEFHHSAVLRHVNEGALLQAACALDLWRRAELQGVGIVVDALVRRRAAEKSLFLRPPEGWTPAPSPVVRPKLDQDLGGSVPATRPVEVRTPLVGDVATAELIQAEDVVEPAISKPKAPRDMVTEQLQAILPALGEPMDLTEPAEISPFEVAPLEPEVPEILAHEITKADFAPAEPVAPEPVVAQVAEPEILLVAPVEPAVEAAPVAAADNITFFDKASEAPPWKAETVVRPTVFADSEDTRPSYRTPASARFAGFEVADLDNAHPNLLPQILLGVLGLAVFAFAVFSTITAKPAGNLTVGATFALIGIACVVISVYSLVHRFLGREV